MLILRKFLMIFFLLLIPFSVFRVTERFDFVNWDDNLYVTQNTFIRSFDSANIAVWFRKPFVSLYTPASMVSFAADYHANGNQPAGYHRTNVILHLVNILLVFVLLCLLFGDPLAAFLGALLFGVHPIQVQTVAWISERKNLLCALFSLSAIVLFLWNKPKNRPVFWGVLLILFLAALLSKVTAVMLPFILLLCRIYHKSEEDSSRSVKVLYFTLPAAGLGVATVLLYSRFFGIYQRNWLNELFFYPVLRTGIYLKNVLFPNSLRLFYPLESFTGNKMSLYGCIALAAMFLLLTAYGILKRKQFGFWLLWAWLWLAPVLALLAVPVADHHFYLPIIGLAGALLCLKNTFRRTTYILLAVLNLICLPLTIRQLAVWQNGETLWKSVLAHHPLDYRSSMGLADFDHERGRTREAVALYEKLIHDWPQVAEAYINLGNLYLANGHLDKALEIASLLEKNIPSEPQSNCLRGTAAYLKNENAKAAGFYEQALKRQPTHPHALLNLGKIYLRQDRLSAAAFFFRKSALLNNDPEAFYNLMLSQNGFQHWTRTRVYFRAMQARMLYYPGSYFQEGYACLKLGRRPEAEAAYRKSTVTDPEIAEAWFHLGLMKFEERNYAESLACMQKVLELKPGFAPAQNMILQIANEFERSQNP
jgi:tetratricopeptide (TPR) repeat protein